ncbi:MAG: hypothetical protein KGY70_13300 [Bacteroidales bacterium]|nr:hypothetical protein [Bacteroidales bacterium]
MSRDRRVSSVVKKCFNVARVCELIGSDVATGIAVETQGLRLGVGKQQPDSTMALKNDGAAERRHDDTTERKNEEKGRRGEENT